MNSHGDWMVRVRYFAAYAVCDVPVARDARRGDHFATTHPKIGEYRQIAGLDAMPVEITEKQDVNREEARRIETRSPEEGVSVEHETAAQTIPPPDRQSTRRRRLLMGVLGALILVAACVFGIPWIREMSTPSRPTTHT